MMADSASSQDPEWAKNEAKTPGGHCCWDKKASQQKTSVRFWQVPSYIDGPLGFRLAKLSARKFTGDFLGTQKNPSKYKSSFYGRIFLKLNGPSHPSRSSFNIEHGPFHWCFAAPGEPGVLPLQRLQAFGAFQWIGGKVGGLGGWRAAVKGNRNHGFLSFFIASVLWKILGKEKHIRGLSETHETSVLQRIINLVHGHQLIVKVIKTLPSSVVAARG